ncbi:hypothetical protein O181_098131 [Austropuccinia psidii MF-1]|uniref:Uncharacterized protein n=1 Tax=Austropuccinia psidii MF-1 TaxID=1389203 RepID=A0A9Q3JAA7_9BASI|nr:hypothetical protein [Austropuccinia psidii MF-1]
MPWLKQRQSLSNSTLRQFELLDCAMVVYMIKMATTSTSHSRFLSSLTQVGLSPGPEADSFVIELFDCSPCPSSSSSLVFNKAAKQGLFDDAKVETKGAKKEKGALKNKGKDSKHGWQSDEEERAAKRQNWEEDELLEQEFLNDQYPHDAGYTKDGGKIGWTQQQRVVEVLVAGRVADKIGVRVGEAIGYSIRATMNAAKFPEYFNDAPIFNSQLIFCFLTERFKSTALLTDFDLYQFPVSILSTPNQEANYIHAAVTTVFQVHTTQPKGDILVFLTGQNEIEGAQEILEETA